jgi:biotin transport system substrate-specific component
VSSLTFTQPRTLTDALLPRRTAARSWLIDAVLIVLFSLFVALTAQIRIYLPNTPVPITGQTLGVLFTGAALGTRRGAVALVLYVIEGLVGLPFFAGGTSGMTHLLGATGGYLISYPLAAGIVGRLAERGWDRRLPWAALAMLIGNAVIYGIGVGWLAVVLGSVQTAIVKGMLPFIVGDLIKIALAALALPGAWALVRRMRGDR